MALVARCKASDIELCVVCPIRHGVAWRAGAPVRRYRHYRSALRAIDLPSIRLASAETLVSQGPITNVLPGDSPAIIQSNSDSLQPGSTLRFPGATTFDFHATTITGKSGAHHLVNVASQPARHAGRCDSPEFVTKIARDPQ